MLFQIEEPDGSPLAAEGPGAAIGIDLSGLLGRIAVSVGGNAELLAVADPPATAPLRDRDGGYRLETLAAALLALRAVAERALARPVTHAAIILAEPADAVAEAVLAAAAAASGLVVTRRLPAAAGVLGAALAAEDDAYALAGKS